MQTSLPSSKKCSIANSAAALALTVATAFVAITPAHAVQAAIRKPAVLAPTAPSSKELLQQIAGNTRKPSFEPLLRRWQILYGSSAASPLLQVANEPERPDPHRYVAVMGAARLGGKAIAPKIVGFLKDRSWMMRTGALRALSALKEPSTAPAVLPLIHDPSLVVRLEAVAATARLKPNGGAQALIRELHDQRNYSSGKALWFPSRALAALATLKNREAAPGLKPLLDHANDPDLLMETVSTLERLTGRVLKANSPLATKVQAWKLELASS